MAINDEEENAVFESMLIEEHIKKLSKKHRLVLALYLSGYNQRECGEILGITRAAAGFMFKKAAGELRQMINEDGL